MLYQLETACWCDRGRVRSGNEDNLYFDGSILPQVNDGLPEPVTATVSHTRSSAAFGVFDGMGGEAFGQVASYLAARTFKEACEQQDSDEAPPKDFLADTVQSMNTAICQEATARFVTMGSTCVMLYFTGPSVYVCNLGDSRAFRLQNSVFLKISEDHTDERFLREHGLVRKPRLTQCLGTPEEEMVLQPRIAKGTLVPGSQFLLCSDGLTDMLSGAEICALMKEAPTARACVTQLMDAALSRGGRDNTTIISIRVHDI